MEQSNANRSPIKLLPLNIIQCNDTDCLNGLHSYRQNRTLSQDEQRPDGVCWVCGESEIDWQRVHQLDLEDIDFVIQMLRTELVRYTYWESDLLDDVKACNHARRKGRIVIEQDIRHRIRKYLKKRQPFDGRSVSKVGNVIHRAQHATACCCRRCMEYWYGIPEDVELSEHQMDFFHALCMRYIDEKMPDLKDEGQYVPRMKK